MSSKQLNGIFDELRASIGWEQEYEDSFFQDIIKVGFNRATCRQAFVLAQIVEELGPITVRGCLYRAAGKVYPDTEKKSYNSASRIIKLLRRANCVSRNKIVDSTRRRLKPSSWSGLADFMDTVRGAYRKNLWERQPNYVEVFVEKDAMAAVMEPITRKFDVHFNIIRGDVSDTMVYEIADAWNEIEKPITAFYFGDHDPNGLRLEQTIRRKIRDELDKEFAWERLSVTTADFFNDAIPGFPVSAKRVGKTFKTAGAEKAWKTKNNGYVATYGDRCVEVDALDPRTIRARLQKAIESKLDLNEWHRLQEVERLEQADVDKFVLAQKLGRAAA